jgi:serine/threonine protein kinase
MYAVSSSFQQRMPCVYDAFKGRRDHFRRQGSSAATNQLVFTVELEPWQRALERADVVRYEARGHEGVTFQPSDAVFSGEDAPGKDPVVRDEKTPFRFVGAVLCDRYKITGYIQSGGFGRGWEGTDLRTGEKMFIKTFKSFSDRPPRRQRLTPEQEEGLRAAQEHSVRKEIEVLLHPKFRSATSIPEVVSNDLCYGSCYVPYTKRSGEMFFIATADLCDGGELFNYICPSTPPYVRSMSEPTAQRLFRQIAAGVAHFHAVGCFHRDLKLENLVVDGKFNCKLMDFGSCKFIDQMVEVIDDEGVMRSMADSYIGIGTSPYKPPNVLNSRGELYDPAAFDVWSCGVLLFYMVAAGDVYKLLGPKDCFKLFQMMGTKAPNEQHEHFTRLLSPPGRTDPNTLAPPHTGFWEMFHMVDIGEDLKHLLNRMFDVDPKTRISMKEVVESEWLRDGKSAELAMLREQRAAAAAAAAGGDGASAEAMPIGEGAGDRLELLEAAAAAEEEAFYTEMRSRPTSASRDRVIKIKVPTLRDAVNCAHRAAQAVAHQLFPHHSSGSEGSSGGGGGGGGAAVGGGGGETSVAMHGTRIDVAAPADAGHDPLYSIIVEEERPAQVYVLLLQWQHGDLGGWLHFVELLKDIISGHRRNR